MGKLIACNGKYAETAYEVERLSCRVHSLEELADCLMESADLLDHASVSRALIEWLSRECGLRELSEQLLKLSGDGSKTADCVCLILLSSGLYERSEIEEVREILNHHSEDNPVLRKMKRAEYFMNTKKYALAKQELASVQKEIQGTNPEAEADIIYKIGLCDVAMFHLKTAAELFLDAYRVVPKKEYMKAYMKCLRMTLTDGAYLRAISEYEEACEMSLEVEKEWEEILTEWDKQKAEEEQNLPKLRFENMDTQKQYVYKLKEEFMKYAET